MPTRLQKITPFLWFDSNAEEAAAFYVSVFRNSRIVTVTRYSRESAAAAGRPEGSAMTVAFEIEGQPFTAINGGPHFKLNEAVSFVVHCDSQDEVDYYWENLAKGGDEKARMCGWLKDRFGLSWQVVPNVLLDLLSGPDPEAAARVTKAMLAMKKLDVAGLTRAAEGRGE